MIDGSVTVAYSVPTRDASLYLEVVHPTSHGVIVRAPAILTYSPYSVLGRNGDAAHWTELGYARMYADVIGTGNSGGCYDYGGNREKRTAYDLVEWVAAQSWSTGKVGMLGGSYDGTTQYAAAVMHPPHLTTIIPGAAIVRWWDYAYSGGLRYTDSNEMFGPQGPTSASDEGVDTPVSFDFGFSVPPPTDLQAPDWAERVQSTLIPCDELEHTVQAYSLMPSYSAFWAERDYLRLLPTVKIPIMVAANWGDWNVKQFNSWAAFHALTGSVTAKLYMGTRWEGHGTPYGTAYPKAVDSWFAHWLKGKPNGIEKKLPAITSATADSAGTVGYQKFTPTKPLRMNLGAGSLTAAAQPAGSASLPWTGVATESLALLPSDGPGLHKAFVTAPLSKDVRLLGAGSLRVRVTSPCSYATLAVSLVDLDPARLGPNGIATDPSQLVAVTRGWMDTRYPNDTYTPIAGTTQGTPFGVTVPLKPTDYTFRKGHRIALTIATDAIEWVAPHPCVSTAPTITIGWGQGSGTLSLPVI